MKLVINYDLINEIKKAKTGINFKRFNEKLGIFSSIVLALNLTHLAIAHEVAPTNIAYGLPYALILYGGTEYATRDQNKKEADIRLKSLESSLTKINIYTDSESLKNAKLYKIKYKLVRDKNPAIEQTKFIMIPTSGTLNPDEISIQQEHIIGTDEYILSIGEPKKSESKVLSKILAKQRI